MVDIGKTLSKVTSWSEGGLMIDRRVRPNVAVVEEGMARLDAASIADWLVQTLADFAEHPIERIIPVAHGAGVVAIDPRAPSAAPLLAPLDYEQEYPRQLREAYNQMRDPFAQTGSPALPGGLNIGTQLFWLGLNHPREMEKATLVPWAQYWTWFLTGEARSEVTSLGCHSDLWLPHEGRFSPLAEQLGWSERFAPVATAASVAGTLRPELARATGLSQSVRVLTGLHDSNAALLAARGFGEIADHEATVLSTGTWFVAMRLAGKNAKMPALSEQRDTLLNVDAYGRVVPSARFMGGREIETVIEIDTRRVDIRPDQPRLLENVPRLLERGTMMLPSLAPGFGPFPGHQARWVDRPAEWQGTWYARRAAICLYAALVADTSLDLVGAQSRLLVEGRFAEAEVFVRALAALRPETEVFVANEHNDVSFGALRLVDPALAPAGDLKRVAPLEGNLAAYRAKWHDYLLREAA